MDKVIKSSDIVKIWVSHKDDEAINELSTKNHNFNDRAVREAVNKRLNELSYAEYVDYDQSRTLVDQLNDILKDETVLEVVVQDNTPNPSLDGANTLLRWNRNVNVRNLNNTSIYYLTSVRDKYYTEEVNNG